ncbi:hypothetical protein SRB5_31800 [Streptomyces sp. RB5]|uniref:Uncharacterized protein n=1 Tax=Streptomyces smaragdinus TaxID=2585196 RepID=A0A7K0CHT4_9ACTN|nr:hypothetical protein [Streptomyces smaragdinus]MQY13040.1 hypothetical protein [Streptomyces smaragdinus]
MNISGTGTAVAVAVLLGTNLTQAVADTDHDEHRAGSPAGITLFSVDNSNADSWLEVDRTANAMLFGHGTAGSDHEGGSDGDGIEEPEEVPAGGPAGVRPVE